MIPADLHKLGHEIFPLPVISVQKLNQTRLILITCKNYHRSIAAINKLPCRRRGWMNLFTLAAYTADMMIWLSCKCIKFRRLKKKKTTNDKTPSSGTTGSKSKMTVSERDTGLKFGLHRNVNTHASLPTHAKNTLSLKVQWIVITYRGSNCCMFAQLWNWTKIPLHIIKENTVSTQ